jgi:hypothetical protein
MDQPPPKRKPPGQTPDRFAIDVDWEEAAAKLIRTPVPPGGVPKPAKKRERKKKDGGGS